MGFRRRTPAPNARRRGTRSTCRALRASRRPSRPPFGPRLASRRSRVVATPARALPGPPVLASSSVSSLLLLLGLVALGQLVILVLQELDDGSGLALGEPLVRHLERELSEQLARDRVLLGHHLGVQDLVLHPARGAPLGHA